MELLRGVRRVGSVKHIPLCLVQDMSSVNVHWWCWLDHSNPLRITNRPSWNLRCSSNGSGYFSVSIILERNSRIKPELPSVILTSRHLVWTRENDYQGISQWVTVTFWYTLWHWESGLNVLSLTFELLLNPLCSLGLGSSASFVLGVDFTSTECWESHFILFCSPLVLWLQWRLQPQKRENLIHFY